MANLFRVHGSGTGTNGTERKIESVSWKCTALILDVDYWLAEGDQSVFRVSTVRQRGKLRDGAYVMDSLLAGRPKYEDGTKY